MPPASHPVRRSIAFALTLALLAAACGGPAANEPLATALGGTPGPSSVAQPSIGTPEVTLVQFADSTDPSAAAEHEHELIRQLREDDGMVALLGADGEAAFAELDAIEEEFAQELIREIAATIDAGGIPQGLSDPLAGLLASIDGAPPAQRHALNAIDVSLFADTGFTTSTIMSMYAGLIQQAAESREGTLPRTETFDQTDPATGLRQQVTLNTRFNIRTGGGRVFADIIMSATDNITKDGSFIALYTSTSTGHFDVSACPDEKGVAAGKYTFQTKHELNDVSTATAARSGAGRSVEAPFRLINGPDAHLQQIEASFNMAADGHGPGTPGGPGPTSPFQWGATQQVNIVMPVKGATTATGNGTSVTGTGGERASGAMFVSSAMAQLFLAEVGKEAERFWRKGDCIEITTTQDSRKVRPGERIKLVVDAVAKFPPVGKVKASIKATFTGKESLEPTDPQDPPATFNFVAGSEEGDKGTIQLEQVGLRGIGKKTVEFTVGVDDYRFNLSVAAGGYSGQKCDGHEGAWTVNKSAPDQQGTITFTIPKGGTSVEAHAVYDLVSGPATSHWDLRGPVTFVPGDSENPAKLNFGALTGTVTVQVQGLPPQTVPNTQLPFWIDLEAGDFC